MNTPQPDRPGGRALPQPDADDQMEITFEDDCVRLRSGLDGTTLRFSLQEWDAFVSAVKSGHLAL
ncbi:hypothetical protein HNP84_007830 [Thermocatellispora tengchongensis]|uniref:DUF397 domain-containing protein n=1 Tax=Thermocatellispora tengchongensis TaxID=1073253 RepID=A0A840PM01_9ACTN|nr:DUF397 domain-containing protein [Thermocatellispora tengchongensis]MBB5138077.1 hypothetical protein [Thermocatellispora tengchongensis]